MQAGCEQVRVVKGEFRGIGLRFIDTPGLAMSGSSLTTNAKVLHGIRRAMKKHRPDLVLYVDRQDVVRLSPYLSMEGCKTCQPGMPSMPALHGSMPCFSSMNMPRHA